MNITDLYAEDVSAIEQVATLLTEGFAEHYPEAWPDQEAALEEVRASFGDGLLAPINMMDMSGNYIPWLSACSIKGKVLAAPLWPILKASSASVAA